MSRFAYMSEEERFEDPAIDETPGCSHPHDERVQEDSGGHICSPSFYCTRCKRLVVVRADD